MAGPRPQRGQEGVPNVAVTVKTRGEKPGDGKVAFAQAPDDPALADPTRPIWIVDREPRGGSSAHTNTWSLGAPQAGRDPHLRVEA